jgi:hypothetical protein
LGNSSFTRSEPLSPPPAKVETVTLGANVTKLGVESGNALQVANWKLAAEIAAKFEAFVMSTTSPFNPRE